MSPGGSHTTRSAGTSRLIRQRRFPISHDERTSESLAPSCFNREGRLMDSSILQTLAGWLADSSRAVAFTGAGISTESGIPDFRSPGGVWANSTPVYFDEFL